MNQNRRMKIRLLFAILFVSAQLGAQSLSGELQPFSAKRLLDIKVRKSGPYFGIQQGRFTIPEIGWENQWKRIKLRKPTIHAVNAGFNYNIRYNVLGFDAGYWYKPHRIGLTFGGALFYRSDFESSRLGIAPNIGFKIWLMHVQVGYHFMSRPKTVFETNKMFISLRVGIINDRNFDVKRNKRKRKKK